VTTSAQQLEQMVKIFDMDPEQLQVMSSDPARMQQYMGQLKALGDSVKALGGKADPRLLAYAHHVLTKGASLAALMKTYGVTGQMPTIEGLRQHLQNAQTNDPLVQESFKIMSQDPDWQRANPDPNVSGWGALTQLWDQLGDPKFLGGWGRTLVLGGLGIGLVGLLGGMFGQGGFSSMGSWLPMLGGLGAAAFGLSGGSGKGLSNLWGTIQRFFGGGQKAPGQLRLPAVGEPLTGAAVYPGREATGTEGLGGPGMSSWTADGRPVQPAPVQGQAAGQQPVTSQQILKLYASGRQRQALAGMSQFLASNPRALASLKENLPQIETALNNPFTRPFVADRLADKLAPELYPGKSLAELPPADRKNLLGMIQYALQHLDELKTGAGINRPR
jgi:hypothetical protein